MGECQKLGGGGKHEAERTVLVKCMLLKEIIYTKHLLVFELVGLNKEGGINIPRLLGWFGMVHRHEPGRDSVGVGLNICGFSGV